MAIISLRIRGHASADHVFATHQQARAAIFSYIMGFYNRTRRELISWAA